MERLQNRPYYREEVSELFQTYVRMMVTRGKRYFYMHTDEPVGRTRFRAYMTSLTP